MTRIVHAKRSQFRRGQLDFLKDPKRRAQGALAKRTGRDFENEIESACRWYRTDGRAVITRNYPPTAGYGRTLHYTGKADVDFSGFYMPPDDPREFVGAFWGRPIAFDAKCITGSASYKHAQRDMHQIEYLLDFSRGGTAGLLLHDAAFGCTWWLTGRMRDLLKGQSVPIRTKNRKTGQYEHHLPTVGMSVVGWDFLPVVEKVTP